VGRNSRTSAAWRSAQVDREDRPDRNDQGDTFLAMLILLTGASGQLGAYLIDRLVGHGHDVIAWSGTDRGDRRGVPFTPIDLADGEATEKALDRAEPDAIIHAAALSSAEAVRLDPPRASTINVDATSRIADWCDRHGRRLVFTSTDLVFDGSRAWNREDDPAEPILAYGRTKRLAEPAVLATPKGVVARLSLLFGPTRCGRPSFFDKAIDAMRIGQSQAFFEDEYRTPLDLRTAAEILVRLAEGELSGLIHVAGRERVSRFELMRRAATALGLDPSLVTPSRQSKARLPEPRPADVSMDTTRLASSFPGLERPTIEQALRPG
jgi:dTDP-4-dehydrorhamnose reductase